MEWFVTEKNDNLKAIADLEVLKHTPRVVDPVYRI